MNKIALEDYLNKNITQRETRHKQRIVAYIAERDGTQCHYCNFALEHNVFAFLDKNQEAVIAHRWGKEFYESRPYAQFDHIIPKSDGGKVSLENGVIACGMCNSERKKQEYNVFRVWIVKRIELGEWK